jgi:DNA-binding beta-propeller fold protein YncE
VKIFINNINRLKILQTNLSLMTLFVFLMFAPIKSQDSSNVSYSIDYLGTLTGNEQFKKNRNIAQIVYNLVLGNDDLNLQRPFAVYSHKQYFWILDQGQFAVIKLDSNNANFSNITNNDYTFFPSLVGLTASKNKIYFTDSKYSKVFVLNLENDNDDITVLNDSISLNQPTGIVYNDYNCKIYICETQSHSIVVLDTNGNFIKRIGKRGTQPGFFNYPTFITVDKYGNIYIVDSMNFRVQIFTPEGEYTSHFGEHGDGSGFIASPKGIAIDSYDHIFLVDALFHRVQIFDIKGNYLSSIGSDRHENNQFWLPSGIFIDQSNKIYICDSYNKRIQMFQLSRDQK